MWQAWERGENCTRFWWENPKETDDSEDPRGRWEDGIKMDLGETGWEGGCVWSGFTWLRIRTVGGLL
jgi:hypothetical protein